MIIKQISMALGTTVLYDSFFCLLVKSYDKKLFLGYRGLLGLLPFCSCDVT